jgi:hypothetical protein
MKKNNHKTTTKRRKPLARLVGKGGKRLDTFPLTTITILSCYFIMWVARKAVRVGKKLNKHIADKEAHNEKV